MKSLLNELLQAGAHVQAIDGRLKVRATRGGLPEALLERLRANRDALLDYLQTNADATPALRALQWDGRQRPLSFTQERLWTLDQFLGGSAHYNIPLALRVTGPFDADAAEHALQRLVARHEPLRTVFLAEDGEPRAYVREDLGLRLLRSDLSHLPLAQRERRVQEEAAADAGAAFDLSSDTLLRASWLKLDENEGVLLVNMHHIASDGWSMGVVVEEFAALYQAARDGVSDPLPPLPLSYGDYAHWQRQCLDGGAFEGRLAAWARRLTGLAPVHALPLDRPRPARPRFQAARHEWPLPDAAWSALQALARVHEVTPFMLLHASLAVLIARYSGQPDGVIGTPVANRPQRDLHRLVGFFANTLALRTDASGDPSFVQFLRQVRDLHLDAQANQDLPFELLVERLNPVRSAQVAPLFQILFTMDDAGAARTARTLPGGLRIEPLVATELGAKFDLAFHAIDTGAGLVLSVDVDVDLFDASTAKRLLGCWASLLEGVIATPEAPITLLPMLGQSEATKLLQALRGEAVAVDLDERVHERFEAQAVRVPQRVAVQCEEQVLSYGELNRRANQLAHLLRGLGVGPDRLVGLCMQRSVEMVVGVLAVLKAGGAYVPLDPSYPQERLTYMAEHARLDLVLTQQALQERVSAWLPESAEVLALDGLGQRLEGLSQDNPARPAGAQAQDLAYVIYTSGSTGRPKGVMNEHRGLLNRIDWMQRTYELDESDVVLQKTPFSFDVSVWELTWAFTVGARLVMAKPEGHKDPEYLARLIGERGVSVLHFVPSMLQAMLASGVWSECSSVKQVFCSGEALPVEAVRRHHALHAAALHNLYGPTEAAIDVTAWSCPRDEALEVVPIGRPIQNIELQVLDGYGRLVPQGVAGELHIGGVGLARGYLHREDLTAERFIANPHHDGQDPHSSARLYRTGDLVRLRADGTVEYLGRIDEQVKIRGFRIELGEIEAGLAEHPGVAQAVVMAREDIPGEKQLVGYVSLLEGALVTPQELKQALQRQLPEYMVPAHVVVLDELPLNPSGKADRRALPAPERSAAMALQPLQGQTEQQLAALWAEVLGLSVEQIGPESNFFSLGGHSLRLLRLRARLRDEGHALDVATLLAARTLAEMARAWDAALPAAHLDTVAAGVPQGCGRLRPEMLPLVDLDQHALDELVARVPGGAANVQDLYPLAPLQEGLYFHHLATLAQGYDAYVLPVLLELSDAASEAAFVGALQQVIDRHDVLRTAILTSADGRPWQVVLRQASLTRRPDWILDPAGDALAQCRVHLAAPGTMDLTRAPLLDLCRIVQPGKQQRHLLLRLHHLIDDATSLGKIQDEIAALLQGRAATLPTSQPYRAFVAHALRQAANTDARAFFERALGDVEAATLPFGLAEVGGDGTEIETAAEALDAELTQRLTVVARRAAVGPATLFHAAWARVLAAFSGREDVVFGTVLSGRFADVAHADRMLGMFINTLPLRAPLAGRSVATLVHETEAALRALLAVEQAPLALAQRCSGLPGGQPLFGSLLNYRHLGEETDGELDGDHFLAAAGIRLVEAAERTHYPLVASVDVQGSRYRLTLKADRRIGAARARRYYEQALRVLVDALEAAPGTAALSLPVIPADEHAALARGLEGPRLTQSIDQTMAALFAQAVQRHPQAVAVSDGQQQLSFAELDARANRLAQHLQLEGVGADAIVGVCLPRGVELMVALLGVLKAGGAYLPLDPAYPAARLAQMLEDAAPQVLLALESCSAHVREALEAGPASSPRLLVLDEAATAAAIAARPMHEPARPGHGPSNLAYVIFTSGSTGRSKGVAIEQRSVVNLVHALAQVVYADLGGVEGLRVGVNASLSFDGSAKQIWMLLLGASVRWIPEEARLDPAAFAACVEEARFDSLDATPGQLAALLPALPRLPRRLLVGGEAIHASLWETLAARAAVEGGAVFNVYGPTETTVDATARRLEANVAPCLGRPLPQVRLHVLDSARQPVPQGAIGELYIGGAGVARGYLGRADLSAAHFVPELGQTVGHAPPPRMYRTGDLVRLRADGELEFLGRADEQVKLRGHRIELGEVEAALRRQPGVLDAVVVLDGADAGTRRLLAYVAVGDAATQGVADALLAQLRQQLPAYMVPTALVPLKALPLSPSGKVDQRALPAVETSASTRQGEAVRPPASETEHLVATAWAEALGIESASLGRDANFFELGGHSLLVIRVLATLLRAGRPASVQMVFGAPTLAALAEALDTHATQQAAVPFKAPESQIPAGCERVRPEMLPLVALTQEEVDRLVALVPGGAPNVQDIYPLAPLQEGILFHHLLDPSRDPYVLPVLLAVKDGASLDALLGALQRIVDRHDALRTAIVAHEAGEALQIVCRRLTLPVETLELGDEDEVAALARLNVLAEGPVAFDLARAPLLRVTVCRPRASARSLVLLRLHHIVSDHVGLEIVQRELMGFLGGEAEPEAPVPYRNFVALALHQARMHDAAAHFKSELGDVDEPTLPFQLQDVRGDGRGTREHRLDLDQALSLGLRDAARRLRTSPATLFHAAWALVVGACSSRDDVVFGTVLSGRLQGLAGADRAMGMFINTLPVRLRLAGQDVRGLVRQAETTLAALLPLEQASLALALRCSGVTAATPLFSALLNYRHSASAGAAASKAGQPVDLGIELLGMSERTNYPFSMSVDDFGESFSLHAQVHASLDPARITGYLAEAARALVEALSIETAVPVESLSILPQAERQALLAALQAPTASMADRGLHEWVQGHAAAAPDRVALVCGESSLSYGELNSRANRLAHHLRQLGLKREARVGLCLDRGVDLIVAMLGTLKAGGAYLPLDLSQPSERLAGMVSEADPIVLLTREALLEKVMRLTDHVVLPFVQTMDRLDAKLQSGGRASFDPLPLDGPRGSALAYVNYTSGSTGTPKGVMVEHRQVVQLVVEEPRVPICADDGVVYCANPAFDASTWEIWVALTNGARLLIIDDKTLLDASALAHVLRTQGATVLQLTSGLFAQHADALMPSFGGMKCVLFGGDRPDVAAVQRVWRQGAPRHLLHTYGPTETVAFMMCHEVGEEDLAGSTLPMGTPLTHARVCVLDAAQRLVPVGAVGELYIGGAGVARGYLGRPGISAERFIDYPFAEASEDRSGQRLYRTGDLVRQRADGAIEFLGRADDQVKIRGFRIEPGEVEAALARHARVARAVVIARPGPAGDKVLVAYVVDAHGASGAIDDQLSITLMAHLRTALPEYMVPTAVMVLPAMPLTPNGKVDKRALPAPELAVGQVALQPLQGETEAVLAQLWAELLGVPVERIGAEANFFALGGHSLTAVRLVSLLRQRLGVELGLRVLFDAPNLRELAGAIERAQGQTQRPHVTRRQGTDEEALPLSYAQTRLWFLDCYDGGSTHYHLPMALRLRGSFEADLAEQALRRVLDRQEALRTVFDGQAEAPRQRLRSAQGFALDRVDLGGLEREAREIRVQALALAHAQAPFDLRSDLLLRASYVKLAQDEGVLLINMHHIASDGWSVGLLVDEFATQYNALRSGRQDNPLAPLAVRYADYAQWQREWLDQDGALEKQLAYWERQLAGLPPVHALALDHARPAQQSFEGATQSFMVDAATTQRLRELGRRTHCTLFMVLHAGLSVLLARHASASDIVIGTPVANRLHKELEDVVGFFANTLVLRTDTSGNPSFEQLLAQVREVNLQAQAHQDVPFEMLVERLNPARSTQYGPLVQVVLSLDAGKNTELAESLQLPGLSVASLGRAAVSAKFELQFNVEEVQGGLALGIDYNCALFEAQTIERMAQHWQRLLHSIAADATLGIHDLPMLGQSEATKLLQALRGEAVAVDLDERVHERFEAQAVRVPQRVAVQCEEQVLSYGELNRRANQLAHLLRGLGVGPDRLVGLCMQRSVEMVVGVLAVLKAGGAYVPLDPSYPQERLTYMAEHARLDLVLTQQALQERVSAWLPESAEVLALDGLGQRLEGLSQDNPARPAGAQAQDLAYVIYTSGSTGRPKGVMNEHRGLLNRIDWMQRTYELDESDVVLQKTPFSFDVSVWELTWAFTVGARLVMAKPEGHKDPEYLARLIGERGVSVLHFVPSMLQAMLASGVWSECSSVKQVFCSGEALPVEAVRRHHALHAAALHNLYGPTEAAIDVTAWSCPRDEALEVVPIGRPIQNIELQVLDGYGRLVPQGVAGELHIGGVGLARGYLHREDLTAERFIANPHHDGQDPHSSARLYRTGDLARLRADGMVEYLGRIDEQVKIRGFRIELGEIEAGLAEHPGVAQAVVMAREDVPGEKQLVGYVSLLEGALVTPQELKQALQRQLPEYMVPAHVVVLDELPLNPSGKADRRALPAPERLRDAVYEAPSSATERLLASIWAELLQLDAQSIGAQANFFALGGHSLMAIRMLARLREAGRPTEVRDVFAAPSLRALSQTLDEAQLEGRAQDVFQAPPNAIPAGCDRLTPEMLPLVQLTQAQLDEIVVQVPGGASNVQDLYPLAPLQEGMYFHHLMVPERDPYVAPLLLCLEPGASWSAFVAALQAVVERHDALRTLFVQDGNAQALQVVLRCATLDPVSLPMAAGEDVAQRMRERLAGPQSMVLNRAPLLRVEEALDLSDGRRHVLLCLHHIVSDHVGMALLQQEIVAALEGRLAAQPTPMPYREFVAQSLHRARSGQAAAAFREALADVNEPTLMFGLHDVHRDGTTTDEAVVVVPAALAAMLRESARSRQIPVATLWHAAWALVVAACSGREDVVFGTVMSGRLQGTHGAEHTLGLFINTLPMRLRLTGLSAEGLVRQADAALQILLAHEQASLSMVHRCTGLSPEQPLFTALLNVRHAAAVVDPSSGAIEHGIRLLGVRERTNYPVSLTVDDDGRGFAIDAQAERGIDAGRVTDLVLQAVQSLVEALGKTPDRPVLSLPVLAVPERQRLLQALRGEAVAVDLDERVHERFEAQAVRVPQRVAVQCEERVLSYGELNRRANQLAHLLRGLGVGPDRLVGLCMQRSVEMVVGVLAVLKAGGAYVPLDPSYPQERLTYMAEHARLDLVLTQQALQERVSAWLPESAEVLALDGLGQRLEGLSQDNPARPAGAQAQDLAYVIYTSGSTGRPKGVMNEHRGLLNRIDWMQRTYELDESDVVLQKTPFSFDVSVWELTWAFTVGARLVMAKPEGHKDPEYLARLIGERGVSVLHFVPSMLQAMLASGVWSECSSVKQVFCSGEALPVEAVRRHHALHAAALHNLYGPTEAAIDVTAWSCPRDEALEVVPIGRPIQNIELQVLDGYGRLVPQGVAGELHIGGVGLARGYLHREDLTAERFIANPHHDGQDPHSSARLYRTGDLVRLRADGTVEYLGRIDEQVKIRGFRIELGEIEAGLAEHPGVAQAVVMAREDIPGEKQLVGYVSLLEGALVTPQELKQALQRQLPEYMVPAHVVVLDELPLNPSGKADRRALPAPERSAAMALQPLQGQTEEGVATLWSELLGLPLDRIGAEANFFALGGHSLTAVRLITQLSARFGVNLALARLFAQPTLRAIAGEIDNERRSRHLAETLAASDGEELDRMDF